MVVLRWKARLASHGQIRSFATITLIDGDLVSARRSFHVAVPNFLRRIRYVRKLIQKHSSGHVISGPFAGMQYVNTSVGSALEPKILGTYELELHDVFERLLDKDFAAIVNVGAGEGYLAVGQGRPAVETDEAFFSTPG